jgi:hypothetical protein
MGSENAATPIFSFAPGQAPLSTQCEGFVSCLIPRGCRSVMDTPVPNWLGGQIIRMLKPFRSSIRAPKGNAS